MTKVDQEIAERKWKEHIHNILQKSTKEDIRITDVNKIRTAGRVDYVSVQGYFSLPSLDAFHFSVLVKARNDQNKPR